AQTPEQLRRAVAAVGVEERLGAAVPADLTFTAEDERAVALRGLRGKPVLLSFNYTGCRKLCGVQLAGLARALHELGWDGQRFSVLTVSIDPAETLPQLRRYKEAFVRQAGGSEGVARGWTFAMGRAADVDALARAVGFRYRYDPASGQFAHQATLVVVTADGRVSGYLHGVTYPPAALRAALERAAAGRVATSEEQASLGGFLLTCIGFGPDDPLPLALKIMRAGGGAAALFLLAFVGVHAARDARRRRPREAR
ncbi:MAG TPA: SCO family protein, partial [Anaeromyxobacter sp.]